MVTTSYKKANVEIIFLQSCTQHASLGIGIVSQNFDYSTVPYVDVAKARALVVASFIRYILQSYPSPQELGLCYRLDGISYIVCCEE